MKNNFLKSHPELRRMIRYAEVAIVAILALYALFTYRELKKLRATPVILPAYWFNVATESDQVQRVQVRGSWVSKDASPEFLHTTTIECVKSRMQCVESSAVVAVNEGGFLESVQTHFDVDSWTDKEILTKTDVQPCVTRTLALDIVGRIAQSVVTPKPAGANCKAAASGEQVFKLVGGHQASSGASNKNK